jgi:hypothetical protein
MKTARLRALVAYLAARLNERSTKIGVLALSALFGLAVTDVQASVLSELIIAALGAALILLPDKGRA